jgi:hypothetical protein
MSLCAFNKEIVHSAVGNCVLGIYRNGGEVSEECVVKHLEERLTLTDEMRSYIGPALAEWVQHLNRKRDEYVQKSKFVTWLTDATYDLSMD